MLFDSCAFNSLTISRIRSNWWWKLG